MHARATTLKLSRDSVNEAVDFFNGLLPDLRALKGFREAYLLTDRSSGDAMTVTVWDSEEDMQAATSFARDAFARMGDMLEGQPSIKTYEVTAHDTGVLA